LSNGEQMPEAGERIAENINIAQKFTAIEIIF